jgi:uncharacterized protein (DUF1015 family)
MGPQAMEVQKKEKTQWANFQPFKGWRYDTSHVNMEQVIAPPYDVISPEEQDRLYLRSPLNCIRLILNKIEPSDTPQNSRYTRAKNYFEAWQKEKSLMQEKHPAFYLYLQKFTSPVDGKPIERAAVIGRLKLEPFDKHIVVPHEKTLSRARADQRQLLETAQASFSPVFGLFEDPKAEVASVRREVLKTKPLFSAKDDAGVLHTVWSVENQAQIKRIHDSIASKKIYIADGHHRYQTALEYGIEARQKAGNPSHELASDYGLMALVEFQDAGLVLLPTHRMVLPVPGLDSQKALSALKPYFKIESKSVEELKAIFNSLEKQETGRTAFRDKTLFGLCFEKEQYLLTLTDEAAAKKNMPAGKPDVWYRLDTSILSHFILGSLWKVAEANWEATLQYTHSTDEALKNVRDRQVFATLLLQAPRVEILREMGNVRELMPQKSTYFYPKLASGLVFYSHLSA